MRDIGLQKSQLRGKNHLNFRQQKRNERRQNQLVLLLRYGWGNQLFPALREEAMLETTDSACCFQREAQVAELQEKLFLFSTHPSAPLQREIWTQVLAEESRTQRRERILNPGEKAKITISSFLITLALPVTCGQGWQVITHSIFYQIKQINLMWLSHILDFPINGCDLPI